MPLSLFCVHFSDMTNYGIVCDLNLYNRTINLEFKNSPPEVVIEMLSKQLGVDFIFRGNTFYIGSLKKADRSFYIDKIFFMDQKDAQSFFQNFCSETGKCFVTTSGILIFVDSEPVINSLTRSIQQIKELKDNTFVCQLFFLQNSKGWNFEAGLKTRTTGTLSYSLSKGQGGNFDFQDLGLDLETVLSGGTNSADIIASPLFLCTSDKEVLWSDGTSYPFAIRNVSSEGTVTTSNYEYKKTGLQIFCRILDNQDFSNVSLRVINSSVTGYVSDMPVLNESEFNTVFHAVSGRFYLVGSLRQKIISNGIIDLLTLKSDTSAKDIQVFFRFYRIGAYQNSKHDLRVPDVLQRIPRQRKPQENFAPGSRLPSGPSSATAIKSVRSGGWKAGTPHRKLFLAFFPRYPFQYFFHP